MQRGRKQNLLRSSPAIPHSRRSPASGTPAWRKRGANTMHTTCCIASRPTCSRIWASFRLPKSPRLKSWPRCAPSNTAARTSSRGAEWSQFDTDKGEWRIPADKMKAGEEHVVPLSRQALQVLKELRQINGRSVRLFVNSHDHEKPMSENTILYALYRMGYHSRAT